MQIYNRDTIDQLDWPLSSAAIRPLLSALVREGTRPFMANVDADVTALRVSNAVLPLTRVDGQHHRSNAYVSSPTTHYIDYAKREVELELARQPLLRRTIPPILEALRPLLVWSNIERIIYVNNWLLSTNLYPELTLDDLVATLRGLLMSYPDHTIVFRSLNMGLNTKLIRMLEAIGFERVFSRQVYLLDPRDGSFRRKNNYGNDRRLAKKSAYRWLNADAIPLDASERLCDLYNDLYLQKYSQYNPQFTAHYIHEALRDNWLHISALMRDGRFDGLLGFVQQDNVITAPLVGYDRSVAEQEGLYRMLMFALVEHAAERDCILHLSSGAASFKRLRGGEANLEYSLVFHRHLPARRRLPWRLLAWLSTRAIIPVMEKYQL